MVSRQERVQSRYLARIATAVQSKERNSTAEASAYGVTTTARASVQAAATSTPLTGSA